MDGQHDLEVLETHVELKDKTHPYGEVVSAHAVVRGQVAELWRVHGETFNELLDEDDRSMGSVYFDERQMAGAKTGSALYALHDRVIDGRTIGKCFVVGHEKLMFGASRNKTPSESGARRYWVLKVREFRDWIDLDIELPMMCGLVLEKVQGAEDVYRRAGLVQPHGTTVVDVDWTESSMKLV